MSSSTTLIFDSSKILDSSIHSEDDPDMDYTISTVKRRSSRQTTSLAGASGTPTAIIDWKSDTFAISGSTRKVEQLRTKRGTFSSSRYWSWYDQEEYRVKYAAEMEYTWSIYGYDGTVLATFTNIQRFFNNNSMPVLHMSPSINNEFERQFLILILLYSETKRMESLKERPFSMVADFTGRGR
ncbi:hypothetical protein MVEN_01390100 [Mycena venus]|uniref:DUF6593 domain-containing protein n=1 Tax=Mycena venus TaxID=2733690 RepID=A0A8H6XYP6_9AGAR|nr:hypothetical protein MVEN_01390100 [Mycena venus]